MYPTIRAADLSLVLGACILRRHTTGRTCLLAAMSPAPLVDVDCHHGRPPTADMLRLAARTAGRGVRVTPIRRGWMCQLYDRTMRRHGAAEVRRTWGTGIRALRHEPRHVLHHGATA